MAWYWDYSCSLIQKGYLHTYLNTYKYTHYDKVRVTLIVSGAHKWGGIYQLPTPTPNPTIKEQKDKLQGYVNSEGNSPRSNTNHRGVQERGSNGILAHIWISHTLCKIYHLSYFLFDKWELFFPDYNCLLSVTPCPLTLFWEPNGTPTRVQLLHPWVCLSKKTEDSCYVLSLSSRYKMQPYFIFLLFTFSLGNSPLS